MSAAAPNPSNMIMLAVLGVGAYWYFTKRATAGTVVTPAGTTQPAQWKANDANLWGAVSKIIGLVTPAQTSAYQKSNASYSGPATNTSGSSGDPYNPAGDYIASTDWMPYNAAPGADWDAIFSTPQYSDLGAFL